MIKQKNKKLKTIFCGTPEFALPVLKKLQKTPWIEICCVVTAPDKPAGRGQNLCSPPVKKLAQSLGLPILQPIKLKKALSRFYFLQPEIIVVAAYGKIFPQELLEMPFYGCLNLHPSLLPKYRGPSPIQFALLNGEKETGVTLMKMTEKMDAGPIYAQSKTKIKPNDTSLTLSQRLAQRSAWLLLKTLPKIIQNQITPQPQDETQATYTKLLTKEDGQIFWNKPAEEIEKQIRAFSYWPGSFTFFKDKKGLIRRLKIHQAKIVTWLDLSTQRNYGEVFSNENKELLVQTGDGCLCLEKVQLEGKKPVSGREFLKGYPEIIGQILS